MDHVKKHPENGVEIIKPDQIGAPHIKGKGGQKWNKKLMALMFTIWQK